MTVIYGKDLRSYLRSPFGCGMMALLLSGFGVFTAIFNLMSGSPNLGYPISYMQTLLAIVIPLITARSLAWERQKGTDALLFSLPVTVTGIVVAKYLAALTLFLIPTAICALYPLILTGFGKISLTGAYTALLGHTLLGAALTALCLFISSLNRKRWLASVWGIGVGLLTFLLKMLADLVGRAPVLPEVLNAINPFGYASRLLYGRLDLPAIVFLLTFIAFFLLLTVLSLESRKRRGSHAPKRKWRTAGVSAGALVIVIAANLLMGLLPHDVAKLNVTGSDTFKVSAKTQEWLRTQPEEDVTLYFLCAGGSSAADVDLYSYLLSYANSGDHIRLEVVDTRRNQAFLDEYAGAAGLNDQSVILKSSRRYKLIDNVDLYYYYNAQMGLVMSADEYTAYLAAFQSGDQQSEYYSYGMYLTQYMAYTQAFFDGDSVLTNGVQFVTIPEIPVVYWLTGNDSLMPDTRFLNELSLNAYGVRGLETLDSIPDNCDLLVIYAPAKDLTEAQAEALRDYLAAGGKLYLATSYTNTDLPELMAVLSEYGMSTDKEPHIICEGDKEYYVTVSSTSAYPYYIWAHVMDHEATGDDFDGKYLLRFSHGIDIQQTEGVTLTPWLYTSDSGYVLHSDDNEQEAADRAEATKGEHNLGVIAQKGESTVVWVASPDAVTNFGNVQSEGGNFSVATSCFAYLTGFEGRAISLAAAEMETSVLAVRVGSLLAFAVLLVLLLPLAILVCGIAVRYIRKRR